MSSVSATLFTIGFTEKTAEEFFELLTRNGVRRLIDTRVSNASQLAGFAKGKDLAYFCRAIGNIAYEHRLDMAPTRELLKRYREREIDWDSYSEDYLRLLDQRELAKQVRRSDLDSACLLCSEHLPEHCHRRLLANYLQEHFSPIRVAHLH